MDLELRFLLAITRRLPRVRGAGVIANWIKAAYLRKRRTPLVADVLGCRMQLDPAECVDGGLLFYPQLYDSVEIRWLESLLRPGDTFLDVGSHIGFYSLMMSRVVGPAGRVLAIEADPVTFRRLNENLVLNGLANVVGLQVGVSDERHTLRLGRNVEGNLGGNSFLSQSPEGTPVECWPLGDLLSRQGITRVAAAKLDIEGFEFRVLRRFLTSAPPDLHPGALVVEYLPKLQTDGGGSVLELLRSHGYRLANRTRYNLMMCR